MFLNNSEVIKNISQENFFLNTTELNKNENITLKVCRLQLKL